MIRKISILGTEYLVLKGNPKDYPILEDANAYTDIYAKQIVIDEKFDTENHGLNTHNPEAVKRKLYRHEILHAFIAESGFGYNFSSENEEDIVNWVAEQFPKMKKIFEELGILD